MTHLAAILAPQFVSGVAYTAERLDSDAPHDDRATADKVAQAEALRLVLREIPAAFGGAEQEWAAFQMREVVTLVADELGAEL